MASADAIKASKTHPLTNRHLTRIFGVTIITLENYRKETERRKAIPHKVVEVGKASRIFYKPNEVEKWAAKAGIEIKEPIDKVLDELGAGVGKNGPKPTEAPAAPKSGQATARKTAVKASGAVKKTAKA